MGQAKRELSSHKKQQERPRRPSTTKLEKEARRFTGLGAKCKQLLNTDLLRGVNSKRCLKTTEKLKKNDNTK